MVTTSTQARPQDHPDDEQAIGLFTEMVRSHRRRDFATASKARRALHGMGVSSLILKTVVGGKEARS